MQLLQASVRGGGWNVRCFCKLPGAQQLCGSCVEQLLLQASEQQRGSGGQGVSQTVINQLWLLPATKHIDSDIVARLKAAGCGMQLTSGEYLAWRAGL